MKSHRILAAFGTATLVACSASAEPEGKSPDASVSGPAALTIESISGEAKAGIEDQFITCVEERDNGTRMTQFFLIQAGVVKSYSQMQNYARPMCDPGQPGCALGWYGDDIGLFFETASGAVNRMVVDLDSMEMTKELTSPRRGVMDSVAQCTSGPFPEGVTID